MENEVWKDIKHFEGLYQVSNCGNVRSLSFSRSKNVCELQKICKNGYSCVNLSKHNSQYPWKISRLVATTFIPNPENKPEVNHIDGNTKNDALKNLEWVTTKENAIHASRLKLTKPPRRKGSGVKHNFVNSNGEVYYGTGVGLSRKIKSIQSVASIYKMINGTHYCRSVKGWRVSR